MKLPVIEELPPFPVLFVGPRTADPLRLHVADSQPYACERCRREVMVAPTSIRVMRADDVVWCLECYASQRAALQPAILATLPDP